MPVRLRQGLKRYRLAHRAGEPLARNFIVPAFGSLFSYARLLEAYYRQNSAALISHFFRWFCAFGLLCSGGLPLLLPLSILR